MQDYRPMRVVLKICYTDLIITKEILGNLTLKGPCILIYSYNKTNEMH
jgi:hypothetical protein